MEVIDKQSSDLKRRVCSYLRCTGIKDDSAVDRLSEGLTDIVRQNRCSGDPGEAVLEQAMTHKEMWFRVMDKYMDADQSYRTNPLAGWYLQAIIRDQPEIFLNQPCADDLDCKNKLANTNAIPPINDNDMPSQPFEMPVALQRDFWRNIAGCLTGVWQKLVTFLSKGY